MPRKFTLRDGVPRRSRITDGSNIYVSPLFAPNSQWPRAEVEKHARDLAKAFISTLMSVPAPHSNYVTLSARFAQLMQRIQPQFQDIALTVFLEELMLGWFDDSSESPAPQSSPPAILK